MRSIPKAAAILSLGLLAACSTYREQTVMVREPWPVTAPPAIALTPVPDSCAPYASMPGSPEYRICMDRAVRSGRM